MHNHCTLLKSMLEDEQKAPGEYEKLLKSICSFDKKACRAMTPIIKSITEDERWHAKAVKEAIDEYCTTVTRPANTIFMTRKRGR
jgi:rubrerythrin